MLCTIVLVYKSKDTPLREKAFPWNGGLGAFSLLWMSLWDPWGKREVGSAFEGPFQAQESRI